MAGIFTPGAAGFLREAWTSNCFCAQERGAGGPCADRAARFSVGLVSAGSVPEPWCELLPTPTPKG